jgi:hypothetical protein
MKEKVFYQFLLDFSSTPERMKHAFEDKRLTKTEKLIIDGYLKIRNNQNNEVIELMKSSGPSPLKFVESQRLLLLGSASNNLSNLKDAESYLHASIEILKNLKVPYFSFFAHFTLFWIYANLNQKEQMRLVLNVMETIPLESNHQEMRLLRCQFCFHQISESYEQAHLFMEKIERRSHELSESDIISFCIDKFSYLIQTEKFHEAYQVLGEMKKYRKFNLNENYNFMKKLLDHIVKDLPIYAYEEEFEKIPLLLNQIKLIQALEEKKIDEAKYFWKLLGATSPETYGDNFHYAGTKCLFSICLTKNLEKIVDRSSLKISAGPTKFDSLVSLLVENKAPVPAALIFEILWGVPPNDKEDLKKISRLVSRAKKEKHLNIVFRKGTYELIGDRVKRSA